MLTRVRAIKMWVSALPTWVRKVLTWVMIMLTWIDKKIKQVEKAQWKEDTSKYDNNIDLTRAFVVLTCEGLLIHSPIIHQKASFTNANEAFNIFKAESINQQRLPIRMDRAHRHPEFREVFRTI